MTAAETYINRLYEGHTCHRYWVTGYPLMIGGSLLGPDDWKHLQDDFGLDICVSAETEHDDVGKLPAWDLIQVAHPDTGGPIPANLILSACLFVAARLVLDPGVKAYVHCQMGGSRSPAYAYALLRGVWRVGASEALAVVSSSMQVGKGRPYGGHEFHQTYLRSIEEALALLPWGP